MPQPQSVLHVEFARVEIEIAPLKREHLAGPRAGAGEEKEERIVTRVLLRGGEKDRELCL